MNLPTIETSRLLLRPWNPNDTDVLCEILAEDGILRYFSDPKPPALAETHEYIALHAALWEKSGYGH